MATSFRKPQLFTLSNGLTLIVEEDHTLPIAEVNACCGTGLRHEGKYLGSGISHMLEHMFFKGTARRAPGSIMQEVASHGGYINACVQYDSSVYWIKLPSAKTPEAIDILVDMMMHASIPPEEFIKEQEVIRREIALTQDYPDHVCWKLFHRTAFRVSPFKEPVLGHLELFNKLTRDEVMAYYKNRYVTNNLCLVIVGDVEAEKIKHQFEVLFKDHSRQLLEPVYVPEEPPQVVKRIGRASLACNLSYFQLAWKTPNLTHPEAPAIEVLSHLLASQNSSFLQQEIVENKGLAHKIYSQFWKTYPKEAFCKIVATSDSEKREEAEQEILRQIELFKVRGATLAEVERSKKHLLATHYRALCSVESRAQEYQENWLATGDPSFSERYFEDICQVTPEEVNRMAAKYLIKSRLTMISVDPKKEGEVASQKKKSLSNKKKISIPQKFILPNGLRLLIYEDTKVPLVSMAALFRGGPLIEGEKKSGLTYLLEKTIVKGTHSKSASEVVQAIENLGGTLNEESYNYSARSFLYDGFSVELNLMKDHCPRGLELLAEILTTPLFSEEEIIREKKKQLAAIQATEDVIQITARNLLQKTLFGTHPYSSPRLGTTNSVASLTPEMVRECYQQLVVRNNGVLAIVGDVHAEEMVTIASKAFSNIPAGVLALQSVPTPEPLKVLHYQEQFQEQEQAVVMKGFLGAALTSPDRLALELLGAECSSMGSRIFKRIRDEKALVYYVDGRNMLGLAPGSFGFNMGVDPKKSSHAREELDRFLNELIEGGFTQEELEKAQSIILHQEALLHESYASLAKCLAKDELMGLGFEHTQHRSEEILGVTLDQVNAVIKKYLGVPGFVEVVVGPGSSKSKEN